MGNRNLGKNFKEEKWTWNVNEKLKISKIRVGRYNFTTREEQGVAKGKRKNKSGKDKEWTVSDLILCRGEGRFPDIKNIKNNHREQLIGDFA